MTRGTNDFIVVVQGASDLRDGKFLKAMADQLYRQDGATMSGDEAARAWLKRRGAGSPGEPPGAKNRQP